MIRCHTFRMVAKMSARRSLLHVQQHPASIGCPLAHRARCDWLALWATVPDPQYTRTYFNSDMVLFLFFDPLLFDVREQVENVLKAIYTECRSRLQLPSVFCSRALRPISHSAPLFTSRDARIPISDRQNDDTREF